MKITFSLYSRLLSGILLFSVMIISFAFYLNHKISERERLVDEISREVQPSINDLTMLLDKCLESENLIIYWGISGNNSDPEYRDKMEEMFRGEIFPLLDSLTLRSVSWNAEGATVFKSLNQVLRDTLRLTGYKFIYDYRQAGKGDFYDYMKEHEISALYKDILSELSILLENRKSEMKTGFRDIEESARSISRSITFFTIMIILIIIFFLVWIYFFLRDFVNKLTTNLKFLSQGIIPGQITHIKKDESGNIMNLMNGLFLYLKNISEAAQKISRNNFDFSFSPVSNKDELGKAMLDLQNNLKLALDEEERRKKEDRERSWTAEGIARINDILRLSSDRLEELAYSLIREISGFTSSQVGALYILNEGDSGESYAEMIAAFAYDRQKHLKAKIVIGEGLVGRCVQEKETIYLTDVPEDYLTVRSGMGQSKPTSILIVPLNLNEKVYGVIELASFSQFEKFKIHFVETIGESIATSISKVKINLQTAQLLEQMKHQTEEMISKEEEMRQNMEELKTTQEQSALREANLRKEIAELRQRILKKD
jgi:hypothetical protein